MARNRIYDIEREYSEGDAAGEPQASAMNFLEWLRQADAGELQRLRKKNVQQQVINRFITTAPKIKPVGKEDEVFVPLVQDDSRAVNQEIVSETLARIYMEQQHYARAKEVYEKLILLYPEKSNYFAALLKDCKKQEQANRK
ncbi:MAG: hypothetical protein ACT6QS_14795 [Flavobacteriales bacterium]